MKRFCILFALFILLTASSLALFGCSLKNNGNNEDKEFTVHYYANGGYFIGDEQSGSEHTITVKSGEKISAPKVSNSNFDLLGWSQNSLRFENPWDFDKNTVTGNISLYAHWKSVAPSRILSVDGGSVDQNAKSISIVVSSDTTSISLDGMLTCSDGAVWELRKDYYSAPISQNTINELSDGDNDYIVYVSKPNGEGENYYNLIVHRSHEITITYDMPNYSERYIDTAMSGERYFVDYRGTMSGGYEPSGWKYRGENVTSFIPMQDMTLDPILKPRDFTVTLDTDGGEVASTAVTATYGKQFKFPVPQKHGYAFDGWFDSEDRCISDDRGNGTWNVASDATVYAHYSPMAYTIKAVCDDTYSNPGSISFSNYRYGNMTTGYTQTYLETITLTANPQNNYVFTGWYDKNGERVCISMVFNHTVQDDATFTAKFDVSPITVTSEIGQVADFFNRIAYGEEYTVKPSYTTVIGHTFDGWYKNDTEKVSSELEYTFTVPVDCPATSYTAKWNKNPEIADYAVTATDKYCTINSVINRNATSLTVPDYITNIGSSAFRDCVNLTSFDWPQHITTIPKYAFSGCYMLRNINIPQGIKEIDDRAFEHCGLTSIRIPQSVTKIHKLAFSDCVKLVEICNDSSLSIVKGVDCAQYTLNVYKSTPGSGWSNIKTVDDFVFYITDNDRRIIDYTGTDNTLELPEDYRGYAYKIHTRAFAYKTYITDIYIPQNITEIGEKAFYGIKGVTSLRYAATNLDFEANSNIFTDSECENGIEVTIASTVEKLPDYMFISIANPNTSYARWTTVNISSVTFEQNSACTAIGKYAFYQNESLTSFAMPQSVTTVGEYAFYQCQNLECTLTLSPDGTSVGAYAFYNCANIDGISGKLSRVGEYAFYMCEGLFGEVPLSANGCFVDQFAFYQCSNIESITGTFTNRIGNYAFYKCTGLSGELDVGGTTVGTYAFADCENITELTIGVYAYYIYDFAFYNCTRISKINFNAKGSLQNSNYYIDSCVFFGLGDNTDGVTVKFGSEVTIVPTGLFGKSTRADEYGSIKIKEIIFEDNSKCEKISQEAFDGLKELVSVTIPKSVTSIGKYAFRNCANLKDIYYNAANCSFFSENNGVFSFEGVRQTAKFDVHFGDDVINIPSRLFMPYLDDTSNRLLVNSVDFSQSTKLQSVGEYAFYNLLSGRGAPCYLDLPESVATIGKYAFYGCDSIVRITLGSGVTAVRENAFKNCFRLTEIVNKSSLPLTLGSTAHGSIAECATAIVSQTKILEIGDFYFYDGENNKRLLVYYRGSDNDVILPGGDPYTISKYVFYGYDITSVSFTNNNAVTAIEDYAFCGTNIVDFTSAPSLSKIGRGAFYNCSNLKSVLINTAVTSIGENAFSACALETVKYYAANCADVNEAVFANTGDFVLTLNDSVTVIPDGMFSHSNIVKVQGSWTNVTKIGARAFEFTEKLESINIPSSVIEIGEYAFSGSAVAELTLNSGLKKLDECAFQNTTGLTNVIIPNTVINIGNYTFENSGVASVTLPNGMTVIPEGMFKNAAMLTGVTVPQTVQSIGDFAFQSSAITAITLPDNLNSIGVGAFDGTKLTTLVIPNGVQTIADYAFQNIATLTTLTVGHGVTSIGVDAFKDCTGLFQVNFNAVACADMTSDGYSPFKNIGKLTANGTVFTFGANVPKVPNYILYSNDPAVNSKLSSIDFENSSVCTEIGAHAFDGLSNVGSIFIPENVTTIGDYAFYDCVVQNIYFNATQCADFTATNKIFTVTVSAEPTSTLHIGADVSTIPSYMLNDGVNSLGAIVFDGASKCHTIGTRAFTNLLITQITIPNSVTAIGEYALANCQLLASVVLPNTLTALPTGFLDVPSANGGALSSITMPTALQTIGDYALRGSSLMDIYIPKNVTSIGAHAFENSRSLIYVTFPVGSTASVGDYAFCGLTSLKQISFPSTMTNIGKYVFKNCTALSLIELSENITAVPEGLAYIDEGKVGALTQIVLPKNVTSIADFAFYGNRLTSVEIPSSVTVIGDYAFYGNAISSINIPTMVTRIGMHAFEKCLSLSSVTFNSVNSNSCTSIGGYAFYALPLLESIVLPSSMKEIGSYAFAECDSLSSFSFGSSNYTSIGSHALYKLPALQQISVPFATDIGTYAFAECTNITTLTFYQAYATSETMTIGDSAFYKLTSLQRLSLPKYIRTIGKNAFEECTSLETVTFEHGENDYLSRLGSKAFYNCISLSSVTLPSSLHILESYTFAQSNQTENTNLTINLSEISLGEIGEYAFENKKMTSAYITASVKKIGRNAFKGTRLQTVTFKTLAGWKADDESVASNHLTVDYLTNFYVARVWTCS